ncbi:MAG: glycosyltransferase, partial [Acetobacteraceae bacterium]
PPRRVLVLYPHDDVVGGQSGASRRVNLLIEFLVSRGMTVRVVQGGSARGADRPGVRIESLGAEPRLLPLRILVLLAVQILGLGRGRVHYWMFWHYVRLAFCPDHRRHIHQAIRWADLVLLQYPFWAGTVLPIARAEGRRVVLDEHDILSEQIRGLPLLKAAGWHFESRAIRRADTVVAVSAPDAALLRQRGFDAILSPSPTDARLFAIDRIPHPRAVLATVLGLDLPGTRFCLFVGSRHDPNVLAVADLRRTAAALRSRPDGADIAIVVVGSCADPVRDGNFIALGRVDDATLLTLYAACAVVLVPIPYGTGVSIKSVEGLATGRPLLGTTVSFRGLDVEPDRHAVIQDDMTRYADAVISLCNDPARSAALGAAGRAMAQAYLPDRAYRPYLDLCGLPHDPPDRDDGSAHAIDPTLVQIAREARAAGQTALAADMARELLRLNPDNRIASLILQHPVPLPECDPLDREAPSDGAVRDPRARWVAVRQPIVDAVAAGNHAWVIAHGRALLRDHADAAELHFLLARSLHATGTDPDAAFAHYTDALLLGFDPYEVLTHRGQLCRTMGRNGRAAKDLVRAVTLHPIRPASWPLYRQAIAAAWGFARWRATGRATP